MCVCVVFLFKKKNNPHMQSGPHCVKQFESSKNPNAYPGFPGQQNWLR